jgi:hypothetical protein
VFRRPGVHGSGRLLRKDMAAGLEWLQLEGDAKQHIGSGVNNCPDRRSQVA